MAIVMPYHDPYAGSIKSAQNFLDTLGGMEQKRVAGQKMDRVLNVIASGGNLEDAAGVLSTFQPSYDTGVQGLLQKVGSNIGGPPRVLDQIIAGELIKQQSRKQGDPLRELGYYQNMISKGTNPETGEVIPGMEDFVNFGRQSAAKVMGTPVSNKKKNSEKALMGAASALRDPTVPPEDKKSLIADAENVCTKNFNPNEFVELDGKKIMADNMFDVIIGWYIEKRTKRSMFGPDDTVNGKEVYDAALTEAIASGVEEGISPSSIVHWFNKKWMAKVHEEADDIYKAFVPIESFAGPPKTTPGGVNATATEPLKSSDLDYEVYDPNPLLGDITPKDAEKALSEMSDEELDVLFKQLGGE